MVDSKTTEEQIAVNDIGSKDDILKAIDDTIRYFKDGDIIKGIVTEVGRDEILLDVGGKTEGIITAKELSLRGNEHPQDVVKIGDEIDAYVLQKEDREGKLVLSKRRAAFEVALRNIEHMKRTGERVKGKVIDTVRGGLIVDIGVKAFMPASLIDTKLATDLPSYIGHEIESKIVELDKVKSNVVLSRKAILEEEQAEVRAEFMKQLKKGQIRTGVVSSITYFGAFVDLGGVDGLIHISELSWNHIAHPAEILTLGQQITVEVLDVGNGDERVSLSLKATQKDPWQTFAREHSIGQIVEGEVVKLLPFGAFVKAENGIEGLLHVSELATQRIENANQLLKVGEKVMVKIIDINLSRRKIAFSLKQSNDSIDPESDDFDPALYGMPTEYDDSGNYKYPEGFDSEKNEWMEGYEKQREEWEAEYVKAYERWRDHKKQIEDMAEKTKELNPPQRRRSRTMKRDQNHYSGEYSGKTADKSEDTSHADKSDSTADTSDDTPVEDDKKSEPETTSETAPTSEPETASETAPTSEPESASEEKTESKNEPEVEVIEEEISEKSTD
ncbi:MAG: 30S ribosomal protein S1 [Bifidobacteriaceae bacterium]|jgi:small subunit ribosomal protein S1|nr:30S ribosomal protein S1 [Bifidobacteriaceae bacterium]